MFGKLTLSAIPYDNPIVMGALGGAAVIGLAALAAITYFGKWGYLWREWLTSVDHKRIGVMYVVLAMVMLLRGFADALMMRTQLALATNGAAGYLPPEHYDQIFTAHGVIMIFFMAMPFVFGLMNFVMPLQIGARDVSFPFMNSVSFWLTAAGAMLVNVSLGVGEFARTGWLAYPPLSELQFSPDVGVDYYIWALQVAGLGTLLGSVNLIVTVLRMRAPGMTLMRMPVFTWATLCTNVLIVASFPVLTVTLALLSLDRYLGMHFFTNGADGNAMLYINLIWTWGHPEVYILVLPIFGVFSEIIATFSGKKLFGYTSMVYATATITVLSFLVWVHHFFTMGAGGDVNAFFGISTMIISIPTGAKIFNWLFTMYRGRVRFATPVLWTIGFMVTFVIGGMTGVLMAVPAADFQLHNSVFLIAHFHNVIIGGVVFGCMAGFNYWFPKVFGFRLDERLGRASFACWLVGMILAFAPLYALGLMGMTRRLNHTDNPAWEPYLLVAGAGAVVILFGIVFQLLQIAVSIRNREKLRDLTGDPWGGRTLEWAVASPPPFYNFAQTPVVFDRDAFADMKARGHSLRPELFRRILMPRNTAAGLVIGALSFVFGFALVWHVWWLGGAALVAAIVTLAVHKSREDHDYFVPAAEVARIESDRLRPLAPQV